MRGSHHVVFSERVTGLHTAGQVRAWWRRLARQARHLWGPEPAARRL